MSESAQSEPEAPPASTPGQPRARGNLKSTLGLAGALIVGAILAMMLSSPGALLESGTPAPAFALPTVETPNRNLELASLRGKVVILDFWQTTCPPCLRQMRDLEVVSQQMGDEVVILGINTEGASAREISDFIREREVRYPVLLDNHGVAARYRVDRLPTVYIVDQEGRVRWSRVGYTPHTELVEIIRELI